MNYAHGSLTDATFLGFTIAMQCAGVLVYSTTVQLRTVGQYSSVGLNASQLHLGVFARRMRPSTFRKMTISRRLA